MFCGIIETIRRDKMKLIIFDLDGTVLDSLSDITDSIKLALFECRLPNIDEDTCKGFLGSGVDHLVSNVCPDSSLRGLVKERYLMHYARLQRAKTKPYEGIIDLLSYLNDRKVLIAVLSNKPHKDTVDVIKHFFPDINFAYVLGKKDENEPKPSNDGCREIEEALDIHTQIVYVGDTNVDIQTAINAGYYPIACSWGFREKDTLEGYQVIFDHPTELLKWVRVK